MHSLSPSIPPRELFPKEAAKNSDDTHSLYSRCIEFPGTKPLKDERLSEHILGRSKKNADIHFESTKVSNSHCRVFLKKVHARTAGFQLEPFIVDTSANGTYLNRTTRIRKNHEVKLKSGDEINLIDYGLLGNSALSNTERRSLKDEVERQSFIVYVPSALKARKKVPNREVNFPSHQSLLLNEDGDDPLGASQANNGSGAVNGRDGINSGATGNGASTMHRESTVFRMVKQHRNIDDHYVMMKILGRIRVRILSRIQIWIQVRIWIRIQIMIQIRIQIRIQIQIRILIRIQIQTQI